MHRRPARLGSTSRRCIHPVGWFTWADIARMWEAAQATDEAKRSFKNGVLGLTWVETGEAPDWQRFYERREPWQIGTVPSGGLFLTAGADVQKDRIEVDVGPGVGHSKACWSITSSSRVARNEPKAGTRFIGCWAKHRTTRSCQVRDRHYESPAVYAWLVVRSCPRRAD
jgi:phage terminase large subunit GpA-like protein